MERGARGLRRRHCAAAALAALLAASAGCATPREFVRTVDESHDAITRGICDVVDATDRAFGDPRVEDRERIVRVSLGPSLEIRENAGADRSLPVAIRAPLPALERRANIFLQVDSRADSFADGGDSSGSLQEDTSISATILTRVAEAVHTGARLDLYWKDGAQTGLRPFVRWEQRLDGVRMLLEQQGFLRSDDGFGARTVAQIDRVVHDNSFVRLRASIQTSEANEGIDQEQIAIYRRPFPLWNAALSVELGASHNRFDGDPATGEVGAAADPDETFLRTRVTGKIWRPWIEYEVTPALHYLWHHADRREWGVTLSLRFVYEDSLRRPAPFPADAASPFDPAADSLTPPPQLCPEGDPPADAWPTVIPP